MPSGTRPVRLTTVRGGDKSGKEILYEREKRGGGKSRNAASTTHQGCAHGVCLPALDFVLFLL